ncbi:ABC transporter ATP-binding protein [Nocardioides dongxiaopingii]|uniref:ABC transporter ATP-binding protein n=1 Tax=Nocardioides dongxiaopingii TaxID=2576036 RepID=UPI001BB06355|nr:ABC transporter ATP-binding protein [Nocardioides dongxiaopingii]
MHTTPLPNPPAGPAAPPVISVTGLRKSYDGRVVVDDLDLRVDAGEVVGLIGANGAGKTTTVECLQGLRRADAGAVRVLGLDPARDAERLRPLIGSQLQDSGLPDRLRVEEAVRLFAGPDAGDAEGLLERFGLAHRRRLHFGTMSGGERQRLFLVLALLNRPRLVILDELTQGLDPAARREVWRSVQQLRADGTTVLLVTHELEEAEALCDRVVVMQAGRVLDSGTPEQLVARHGGPVAVRFGLPAGRPARDLAVLRALPGVLDVERSGDRVAVHGRRSAIAHVGAWLVARGEIPEDLSVTSPDLEGALLALLDTPTPSKDAA